MSPRSIGEPLRLLTISSLYPNAVAPDFGVFVENRLRHLVASGEVQARVVAPVPWFPSRHPAFGAYAALARVPAEERRHGLQIDHPRYLVIPKLGMSLQPMLLYRALRIHLDRLIREGQRIDLIDAHYVYPDGVAAALLARRFHLPLVITARGTDLNLIPRYRLPRRWIVWALGQAQSLVGVCEALARVYIELGASRERVRVLRNGVDLDLFRPLDRTGARRRLGLDRPCLIMVGQLIERKGVDLAIRALPLLPDVLLLLVGAGPLRAELERLAASLGVVEQVRFLGQVPHAQLPELYGAADALVLASSREGWPNVLLEAMACGTPVLAAPIWGVPEVVREPAAGRLLADRTPEAIAAAWRALQAAPPARAATRHYAERFSWDATTQGQLALFREILSKRAAA